MENKHIIGFIAALVIILGGIAFISDRNAGPAGSDLAPFAQCLKDKGAVFYGAFWCSHCQATKALFGKAAKDLPYVECSTPDARGQTQACTDKGVKSYPTWIFADGSRFVGEITLNELASRTGCPLPQTGSATSTPPVATSTPMSASTTPTL